MPPHSQPLASNFETALETASVFLFYPDKENRGAFLDSLRACGIKNPCLAEKPAEAIHQLITRHFDVILVFYAGNIKTVEQFIEELRSLEAIAGIPLLAITADGSSKNVLRIMSRQVDRVLITPLSRKNLEEALKGYLWMDGKDTAHIGLQNAINFQQQGAWDQAETEYLNVLKQTPQQIEALMGMSSVLLHRKQGPQAVDYLKEAMKAAKQLTNVVEQNRFLSLIYSTLGEYFAHLGANEQAVKHYKAALKLNPFSDNILPYLIPLMAKSASIDDILLYLTEVGQNYPPYSGFRDKVSECLGELLSRYIALNIQENIDKIHNHLIILQHSNINLHLKTIDHLQQKGQHTTIKQLLDELLVKIKDADLMVKLADLYVSDLHTPGQSAKNAPAITVDREYIKTEPAEYWLKQAQTLYKNALLLEPYDIAIWLRMLRCHLLLKEFETASQLLDRMFENMAITQEDHAAICTLLIQEKAYKMAKTYLDSGLKKYPKESRFHYLASQMHNAEGNHYEAVTALKTGLRENPDSIECLTELGATYGLLKNWSQAVESYEKAAQLCPDDPELQKRVQSALQAKYQHSQGT